MPVLVKCGSCAKSFRAQDETMGRDVPCPACGQTVKIEGPQVAPYDVFISYSSKDKTIADAAVAVMEAKGIRCWVAPRDIIAGKEWGEAIIDGINNSRMMVLIFSTHANESQQVLREVERAVHRGIPIVPFRIEKLMPSRAMEYFISTHHWLDAYLPPLEEHLNKLTATAEMLLSGVGGPAPEQPADLKGRLGAAMRTLLSRDKRVQVLAALAALMFVLLVVGGLIIAGAIYWLRAPKASKEIVKAKADAEVMMDDLRKLDRGQGFDDKVQALDNELKTGEGHYDQKEFGKALENFKAVLDQGPALKESDRQRSEATAASKDMEKAKLAAEEAKAPDLVPDLFADASTKAKAAGQAFDKGDFADARSGWEQAAVTFAALKDNAKDVKTFQEAKSAFEAALKKYDAKILEEDDPATWKDLQARTASADTSAKQGKFSEAAKAYSDAKPLPRQILTPRLKYLAHEAGVLALMIAQDKGNLSRIKIEEFRRDFQQRIDARFKVLDSTPMKLLGLSGGAVSKLRQATQEQNVRDVVLNDFPAEIQKLWGKEIEQSYLVGKDLTLCVNLLFPLTLAQPDKRQVPGILASIEAWAKEAGYPPFMQSRVADLKKLLENDPEGPLTEQQHAAAYRVIALLRHYEPGPARHSTALGATLFRIETPAPGSVEAFILQLGGLYLVDATKPERPIVFVELQHLTLGELDLQKLAKLTDVRVLDLSYSTIPRDLAKHLKSLAALESLEWHSTATDANLNALEGTNLQALDLTYCNDLTAKGTASLKQYPKLERLTLDQANVDDQALQELQPLTGLKELNLHWKGIGRNYKDATVDALRKALPKTKIVAGR